MISKLQVHIVRGDCHGIDFVYAEWYNYCILHTAICTIIIMVTPKIKGTSSYIYNIYSDTVKKPSAMVYVTAFTRAVTAGKLYHGRLQGVWVDSIRAT